MTMQSGFFNSVNGDRKYKAEFFAAYFATFIGNGVFPNPSTNFQVISNNNMTITVKPGKAWINGYVAIDNEDCILQLDPADGALNRIDRVVLRWDIVDRKIKLEVKKGAFASSPAAPKLQRDVDAYELGIADIKVNKGAVSIIQANITDLRLSTELCGIVHGTVNQVDTTTLFNQYQSWIEQKKGEFNADLIDYTDIKKQEFEDWVNSIHDILDENAAGNLLLMINQNTADIQGLFQSVSNSKELLAAAITDKGILTNSSDTFQTMATNISNIENRYSTFELVTLYGFDPIIALNHYIRRQ